MRQDKSQSSYGNGLPATARRFAETSRRDEYGITVVDKEIDRLLDSIRGVPYLISPFGEEQIISFDKGIIKLTGYSADDILTDKQLWLNMIHPADQKRVFGVFGYCKSRGLSFQMEYRLIHKNGSLCWVVDEGEPFFDERVKVVQIEGIITDISGFREIRAWCLPNVPELQNHAIKSVNGTSFGCRLATSENRLDEN